MQNGNPWPWTSKLRTAEKQDENRERKEKAGGQLHANASAYSEQEAP
jgi:hypothetical protein